MDIYKNVMFINKKDYIIFLKLKQFHIQNKLIMIINKIIKKNQIENIKY